MELILTKEGSIYRAAIIYEESVYKVRVWIIMFGFEAFAVLKTKEFTIVNDCFQDKSNEETGHYGQTLIKYCHHPIKNRTNTVFYF